MTVQSGFAPLEVGVADLKQSYGALEHGLTRVHEAVKQSIDDLADYIIGVSISRYNGLRPDVSYVEWVTQPGFNQMVVPWVFLGLEGEEMRKKVGILFAHSLSWGSEWTNRWDAPRVARAMTARYQVLAQIENQPELAQLEAYVIHPGPAASIFIKKAGTISELEESSRTGGFFD